MAPFVQASGDSIIPGNMQLMSDWKQAAHCFLGCSLDRCEGRSAGTCCLVRWPSSALHIFCSSSIQNNILSSFDPRTRKQIKTFAPTQARTPQCSFDASVTSSTTE